MSILSAIFSRFKKKKQPEEDETPIKVEVVKYAPPPKSGEPVKRRALLKHWLNAGEKPPGLTKMEKSMTETWGNREQANKLLNLGERIARRSGHVIGSFGRGLAAGSGGRAAARTLTAPGRRSKRTKRSSEIERHPLSGFDDALTGFDIPFGGRSEGTGSKKKRGKNLPDMNVESGFDKAFDGFNFKW